MTTCETPQIASSSIHELIEEAAVCTGYDGIVTITVKLAGTAGGSPQRLPSGQA